MNIQWTKVTWYSQIIAVVLFVGIFVLGLLIGMRIEEVRIAAMQPAVMTVSSGSAALRPVVVATYKCDAGKEIQATYDANDVSLALSDGRSMKLPHAMSADGARYANANESVVFWNVGQTAFMTEGSTTTFANCTQIAAPVQ